jgi:ketosteroid isomerase-like protein
MSDIDHARFLARFTEFGREPTPARYLDLFDTDGTVQHPGMPRPLAGSEIDRFIAAALDAVPDFGLEPVRWCGRDDTMFVEAECAGTVQGRRTAWPAIYCVTLRGDRVIRGRSYYDRAAVLSGCGSPIAMTTTQAPPSGGDRLALPEIQAGLIEPYIDAWRDPKPERLAGFYAPSGCLRETGIATPLRGEDIGRHYGATLAQIDGLRRDCKTWAAQPGLAFVAWRMTGATAGQPFDIGVAERLTLHGCNIAESVSYVDTLALAATRHPSAAPGTVFDPAR